RPLRRQLFLNFKGGTGKTSVSTSYAFRLAEMGHRVLVIDLDSQGHASKCLGVSGEDKERTLFDAIIKKSPIETVIVRTGMPGLDLVPSNLTMSTIDLSLMPLAAREFRLRNVLKEVEGTYDYAVLDAPPSFGLLNLMIRQCTKFAQASSEGIPIFAYDSESKGAQDIQAVLDEVQARIGAPVRLKAVESA